MTDTKEFRHVLKLAQVLILVLAAGAVQAQEGRSTPGPKRGFEQVQIELLGEGSAALLWARPVSGGHDLLLAVRDAHGALAEARRINRSAGDAHVLALDEARPALATDGERRIGVAWFDDDGRLWMTRSDDSGGHFEVPQRVDGGKGRPEHAFVHAAFAPDGALHVVWLDARGAPRGHEEPAHVYHRSWGPRGMSPETGLTIGHTESVCGCCRPFVRADRRGLTVVYRSVGDGNRDVHAIRRPVLDTWTQPERVGPPLWKIASCPMSGPITDGETTVWKDGSTQEDRIVEGFAPDRAIRRLAPAAGRRLSSPRWVGAEHVLVPGSPSGLLLEREGGAWTVVRDDLPAWCSDLARLGKQWLMVGDVEGRLEVQALVLASDD